MREDVGKQTIISYLPSASNVGRSLRRDFRRISIRDDYESFLVEE